MRVLSAGLDSTLGLPPCAKRGGSTWGESCLFGGGAAWEGKQGQAEVQEWHIGPLRVPSSPISPKQDPGFCPFFSFPWHKSPPILLSSSQPYAGVLCSTIGWQHLNGDQKRSCLGVGLQECLRSCGLASELPADPIFLSRGNVAVQSGKLPSC